MSEEVVVVGGGVIGLTCALRLAGAGHRVRVLGADPWSGTTSAVAAAVWSPYLAAPLADVVRWSAVSFEVLASLTAAGTPGVWMRPGTSVVRDPTTDLWWTDVVPGCRRVDHPGAAGAVRAVVPVVDTGVYLPWLLGRLAAAGVTVDARRVDTLADVDAATVVLAAGLASGPLLGDDSGYPIRGQVVRLANPGLTDWWLDEDNPAGLTYVVPRGADVVCGGTAEVGEADRTPDPATEAAVLARCTALEPALRGVPVRSRGVGLRPGRPTVRVERIEQDGRAVVCCYGHGGAGVTLSWGCAADVVALVGR